MMAAASLCIPYLDPLVTEGQPELAEKRQLRFFPVGEESLLVLPHPVFMVGHGLIIP